MNISVDRETCQGHARCVAVAPELFALDEMGHSQEILSEVPPGLEDKAERAEANCPERAIKIS